MPPSLDNNAFGSQAELILKKADAVINFDRLLSFPRHLAQ